MMQFSCVYSIGSRELSTNFLLFGECMGLAPLTLPTAEADGCI